jgi:CheY-like chemotaxis protein
MASVLVVDDESPVRELLVRWITNGGHQVREAATAVAALEEMAATPAGVVLCDVHMPGQDGLWLTGQLRTKFPETAIVLATGDRTIPAQISMQPGVVEYLGKPFTRGEVLEAVRIAGEWHTAAVNERGRTKPLEPLPKAWIGVTKD